MYCIVSLEKEETFNPPGTGLACVACGCCEAATFTDFVTVLTVDVWPAAVTTDGKVVATDVGADDTGRQFVCADDVISTAVDCAGTAVGLVTAADAAGGWVPATRVCCAAAAAGVGGKDVADDVTVLAGTDCADCTPPCAGSFTASACCFSSRSRFTCVTMLVI